MFSLSVFFDMFDNHNTENSSNYGIYLNFQIIVASIMKFTVLFAIMTLQTS